MSIYLFAYDDVFDIPLSIIQNPPVQYLFRRSCLQKKEFLVFVKYFEYFANQLYRSTNILIAKIRASPLAHGTKIILLFIIKTGSFPLATLLVSVFISNHLTLPFILRHWKLPNDKRIKLKTEFKNMSNFHWTKILF